MPMHNRWLKRNIILIGAFIVVLVSCLLWESLLSHSPSYSQSTFSSQSAARTNLIREIQSMTAVPVMLPETFDIVEGDLFATPTYIDQDRYDVTISTVQDCSVSACSLGTISGFRVDDERIFFATLQEFIPDGEWLLEEGLQGKVDFYYEPMICRLNCTPSSIYWVSPDSPVYGGSYIYQISVGSEKEDVLPLIWSLVNS